MAEVRFENVEKRYGDQIVVHHLDLDVRPAEFVTLLGPSGCGKTTCLRMIAGFVAPTSGRIVMDGRDVTALPPFRRNTGMVFQNYALFPHRTVAENVAFGLEVRRISRAERDRSTAEALRLVRLEHLAERYPSQLSGGQRQRVALARAVVIKPDVLLLDEPLAALDLKLREELQIEIKRVQSTLNMTTVFVTYDQGEALGFLTVSGSCRRAGSCKSTRPSLCMSVRLANMSLTLSAGRTSSRSRCKRRKVPTATELRRSKRKKEASWSLENNILRLKQAIAVCSAQDLSIFILGPDASTP